MFVLPLPTMSRGVISLGLPFPAFILGSWPGITHSCEILSLLAKGKGCFHSWKVHLPLRCYTLSLGSGEGSLFLTRLGQGWGALVPMVICVKGPVRQQTV